MPGLSNGGFAWFGIWFDKQENVSVTLGWAAHLLYFMNITALFKENFSAGFLYWFAAVSQLVL